MLKVELYKKGVFSTFYKGKFSGYLIVKGKEIEARPVNNWLPHLFPNIENAKRYIYASVSAKKKPKSIQNQKGEM